MTRVYYEMLAGCDELMLGYCYKLYINIPRMDPTPILVDPTHYQTKNPIFDIYKMEYFRELCVKIFPYIRCMCWWR